MTIGDDLRGDDELPERRVRVDVYHHWPTEPLKIEGSLSIAGLVTVVVKGESPVPASIRLVPGTPTRIPKGPLPVTDFILEDDQQTVADVAVFDTVGNVVAGSTLDAGSLTLTVSDPTILTATASADQSTVTIAAVGPEATDVTVTPAGTLNGTPLVGVPLAIDVVASAATSVGLIPGTPTTITPAGS